MKMMLLKGLIVLGTFSISSCKELNPFAIDHQTAEIVREKQKIVIEKGKKKKVKVEERISCFDEKVKEIVCFDTKDQMTIRKCLRKCEDMFK